MTRLWMMRGDAEDFKKAGAVRIGFGLKRDLSSLPDRTSFKQALIAAGRVNNAGNTAGQLFRFVREVQLGDLVLTYDKGRRTYLVGHIKGSYQFDAGHPSHFHSRSVDWTDSVPRDALSVAARNSLGSLMTVFEPDAVVAGDLQAALNHAGIQGVSRETIGRAIPAPASSSGQDEGDDTSQLDLIRRDVDSRAHELIKDRIIKLDWEEMQELVAAILRAMGYKTRVSAPGADRGRDILASPDGLGLSPPRIKVEVKHRSNSSMGAPELRSFIGGLRGDDRGLYVSTGGFTREAQYEAERAANSVALLDLDDLAELLVQHYDAVDADGRALVPLKRVFFPA